MASDSLGAACPQCGLGLEGAARPNPVQTVSGRAVAYSTPKFVATPVIIGLNVLMFVVMVFRGVPPMHPQVNHVIRYGADWGPLTLGGQFWRLLASNYIHFGFEHLLLNMWCLWGLGKLAECFYRTGDYILLYTFTGIASSIFSVLLQPLTVSAGASGAIFGVAGVMLSTLKWGNLGIHEAPKNAMFKGVLRFAGINLLFGLAINFYYRGRGPQIGNVGHISGLLAGVVIGTILCRHLDESMESRQYRRKAWLWMTLGLAFVLFLIAHVRFAFSMPVVRR